MKLPPRPLFAGAAVVALAVAGCSSAGQRPAGAVSRSEASPSAGSPTAASPASPSARPAGWAVATSAAAGGGMAALVAAARKEGALNVIALPAGWANYGAIIERFTSLYGITVHSIAPGDRSPQEIAEIRRDAGTGRAAEVLDYGGFMSVGYSSARFGTITSLRQLLGPRFSRAVALDGNPAQANAALYGVMMANLALGGSPGSIAGGVAFFRKLRAAGNFVSVPATTPLTIEAGSTPVVFNWDYLNTPAIVGQRARAWKVFIPRGGAVGEFHAQAINAGAPHPAAARLWEEFLYSQARRGGQNLWLEGGVRPVEQAGMIANGGIDAGASGALPPP